jgi:hypothetical protein
MTGQAGRWQGRLAGLMMLAVLALAWLVMLHHLARESIWYDEWITWDYSRRGPVGLTQATAQDVHPPLYYVWVWLWLSITGSEDVFVMRLSSAIPGLLAVALSYRLGADWFGSRWVGLGAAVFLATSGIFIYYTRELRMYTLVVMLAVWSWLALGWFVRGRQRWPWLYGLSVGLLAYTYYFSAFMVAAQALAVLLLYRQKLPRLLAAYAGVGLTLLPWLPTFFYQLELEAARAGQEGAIGKFAATEPTSARSIGAFIDTYSAGQTAFVLLLAGLALLLGWGASRTRGPLALAGLWLVGTMALFFGLNLIIPVYNMRYALVVVPALALIVGSLALYFTGTARLGLVALTGVGGLLFHADAFLPPKLAHGELLPMIAQRYRPGDRIWYNLDDGALGSSLNLEAQYYLTVVTPELNTDWFIWNAPRDFADVDHNPRVWDVRPYWIAMPSAAEAALLNGRDLVSEEVLRVYTIRLYEAPPASDPALLDDRLAVRISPAQAAYAPGAVVQVTSWWQALSPLPLDYSYALFLRDPVGALVAQVDAGLEVDGRPTSQWPAGADFRPLPLRLALPTDLPPGDYEVWLAVYFWQNPQPLPITGGPLEHDGARLKLAAVRVD